MGDGKWSDYGCKETLKCEGLEVVESGYELCGGFDKYLGSCEM